MARRLGVPGPATSGTRTRGPQLRRHFSPVNSLVNLPTRFSSLRTPPPPLLSLSLSVSRKKRRKRRAGRIISWANGAVNSAGALHSRGSPLRSRKSHVIPVNELPTNSVVHSCLMSVALTSLSTGASRRNLSRVYRVVISTKSFARYNSNRVYIAVRRMEISFSRFDCFWKMLRVARIKFSE